MYESILHLLFLRARRDNRYCLGEGAASEHEYLPQTRISTYYTHEAATEAGKEGGYMGGQQGVAAARRKEGRQIGVIAVMDETH